MKLITIIALFTILTSTFNTLALDKYTVKKGNPIGQLETWEISDANLTATIVPDRGAMINSIKRKLNNVSYEVLNAATDQAQITPIRGKDNIQLYGIPILFPFSNRIKNGEFQFNGKTYKVTNLWNDQGPIHGYVYAKKFNLFKKSATEDNASISFIYESDNDNDFKGNFGNLTLMVTYTVQKNTLHIRTEITNNNKFAIPVEIGFHPFFKVDNENRSKSKIRLNPSEAVVKSQWKIKDSYPTGKLIRPDNDSQKLFDGEEIGDSKYDNVYYMGKNGDKSATLEINPNNIRISIMSSENFKNWVVCVPDWKSDSIMIEPCTSVTNAVNMQNIPQANLNVLKPGETQENWFTIQCESIK